MVLAGNEGARMTAQYPAINETIINASVCQLSIVDTSARETPAAIDSTNGAKLLFAFYGAFPSGNIQIDFG
jgi:hypothetical protein